MALRSDVAFFRPGFIRGVVFDPERPGRRWVVGLSLNDELSTTGLANADCTDWRPLPDLPSDCGFEFNLNTALFRETDKLTLSVVNSDDVLLDVKFADLGPWRDPSERESVGHVRHVNGLTLSGTLDNGVTEFPSYEVLAFDGDRIVGRTRVFRWQHIGDPRHPEGRAVAFDLLIDAALADGRPRKLRIETATGRALNGSPLDFIAFPNSFKQACLALLPHRTSRKADMVVDRLLENSMPLTAYADLYPDMQRLPQASAADGALGPDGRWRSVPGTDWVLVYHVAVMTGEDLAETLLGIEGAGLVYFDLAVRRGAELLPLLFPAFDLERTLEQGYAALCFALPRRTFEKLHGVGSVFALFLRAILDLDRAAIYHIPHPGGVLAEAALIGAGVSMARALKEAADLVPHGTEVEPISDSVFPALWLHRPVLDRAVSIIISTRNEGEMLKTCIDSLIAKNSGFDLDILVVDNGTTDPTSQAIFLELESRGVRILEYDEGFNFSVINNLAVEHALHEQICFLNNDVEFPVSGVLEELCSRLSDQTVGAVGPLMVRASDIIQHGGVVLGPHHGACHAFEDRMRSDPGYGEMLKVAREVSAVTGAMLMTRKSLFLGLGGFEEQLFAVNFNDVDYCLRLWTVGQRVIFTPHVWIRHFESVSRGRESLSPAGQRMLREVANLRLRWRDAILNDPFFHPLLSIDTLPYRALSTQHRDPAPRRSLIAPSSELPRWI